MKRSKAIRRKTRLKAKRATKRRSGRVRDEAYMEFVRTLPCCAPPDWTCIADIEAHHAGKRAAGRKASDDTCIPLCSWHHGAWHGAIGPFKGWTRDQRRSWADARIAETQAAWRAHGVTTAFEELKW